MYEINLYQKEDETIVNDANALLDGNFAVINQSWVIELLLVDEEIPVLCIAHIGNGMAPDPSAFDMTDIYYTAEKHYFTGDTASDAITELYYSLIRHRNVEEFVKLYN